MEKAILKTLIYADIFDYPLKVWEIHKWLIGQKVNLYQVEKTLEKLRVKGKALRVKDYYFLPRKANLVAKRKGREKQSAKYLRKAKVLTFILKLIPWIKLVGISGGLAMDNAEKKDDIDLFLVTTKNRLWLSRILTIGILDFMGVRRKAKMKGFQVAGKLCLNILLEEDKLEQSNKDMYLAHEVLQMRPLWYRDGIYEKYLQDNQWVFKYVPNWIGSQYQVLSSKYYGKRKIHNTKYVIHNMLFDIFEKLAKKLQLWYMKPPQGMERIEDGALYFHPKDIRPKILKLYRQKIGTP